jgi:uncharacterized protein YPO0396
MLLEDERALHVARAAFSVQQEEALRDQRVTQERLALEAKRVDEKLHRLRTETQAYQALVDRSADDMNALSAAQKALEDERMQLQDAAARVEAMAQKVRLASEASAETERRAHEESQRAAELVLFSRFTQIFLSGIHLSDTEINYPESEWSRILFPDVDQ